MKKVMSQTLYQGCITVLCICQLNALAAQVSPYQTLKVYGVITLASSKKPPVKNQNFSTNEKMVFGSAQDFLLVRDAKNAFFMLCPELPIQKYPVKPRVKPIPIGVGTRPGIRLSDMQLRQFFMENNRLLLLNGRFSLELGKDAFPMDEKHFFYAQFIWKGDTIYKKLGYRGDTLIIQEKDLFKVDGHPIDPKEVSEGAFFIRYFLADKKESIAYPDLTQPVYIKPMRGDDIKQEIIEFLDTQKITKPSDAFQPVDDYLFFLYGRVGERELTDWLKTLKR